MKTDQPKQYGLVVSIPVELPGYRFLGWGPAATGSSAGWTLRSDLFGRCPRCGDLISLWPDRDESCRCGALYKDVGASRFGSSLGDDSIAIYSSL